MELKVTPEQESRADEVELSDEDAEAILSGVRGILDDPVALLERALVPVRKVTLSMSNDHPLS